MRDAIFIVPTVAAALVNPITWVFLAVIAVTVIISNRNKTKEPEQ